MTGGSRWRILYEEFRRHRLRFAAGTLLLLATNGLALAIPWMLKFAIDAIEHKEAPRRVAIIAASIAVVALLQALVRTLSRVAILGASRHIVYSLRNRFFERLITLPTAFFDRHRTGDLMSRAVNDLMLIRSFFGPGIMNLANTLLSWTGAVAFMAAIDLRLTLWSLIPYPFVLIAMNRLSRAMYRGSQRAQEQLATLSSRAQENLAGIAQVKAYDIEVLEIAEFNSLAAEMRRRNLQLARVRGAIVPLMGSVGAIGTLLVLWIGTRHLIEGTLTLGSFVAFNAYLASLAWPTIAMGWILNVFQRSQGALERIAEVLEADADRPPAAPTASGQGTGVELPPDSARVMHRVSGLAPESAPESAPEPAASGSTAVSASTARSAAPGSTSVSASAPESTSSGSTTVSAPATGSAASGSLASTASGPAIPSPGSPAPEILVSGLSFSYAGSQVPALQDVSFRVRPGGLLGIVGPVGSGKTTLVRLLARLYAVPSGTIRLGGVEIGRIEEADLRETIAVVPQESFLFSMSLADNIALGRPDAPRAKIEEAGRQAGLTDDLKDLPQGYDTRVGERGYTLSGGQRQRAALARALLMEPRVLLLDDPFASVDAGTEEAILHELSILDRMTRIVAGHRVSAVQDADEILVLDGGKIVERGTHADLIAGRGLYAHLFERQLAEREIERA